MEQERALDERFPFLKEKGHVISIVGAGGKTTLMNAMAHVYQSRGQKVLITTTTHIMRPLDCPVGESMEEVSRLLKGHGIVAAGTEAPEGKLQRPEWLDLEICRELAAAVIVEADGAKHFPCKVPLDTEPVIVEECDIVLGVLGMDAVGRPLKDVCFRREQAMRMLGVGESHLMTAEDMAVILTSERGTRKHVEDRDYWVVLNKCSTKLRRQQADQIEAQAERRGLSRERIVRLI